MSKLTQHFVEKLFQERGCVLLDVYINSRNKVKYKCNCGSISFILVPQFVRGQRCANCHTRNNRKDEQHYRWNSNRQQVESTRCAAIRHKDLLHGVLLRLGQPKEDHTHVVLGYSAKELLTHLQKFPTWPIVSQGRWNIDHIFPVKAFQDHGIYDPYFICALDNLQPLSANENRTKNDKYSEQDFLLYCKKHNLAVQQRSIN